MANLTAVPTQQGIGILNTELRNSVTKFVLIGATNYTDANLDTLLGDTEVITYADIQGHVFYHGTVESAYFDDDGVLTFELLLPLEDDLQKYTYAVGLVSQSNELVSITPTPKIVLISGVGGTFVVKLSLKGSPGEIVFKNSEYVTPAELQNHKENVLRPVVANTTNYFDLTDKLIEKGVIDVNN